MVRFFLISSSIPLIDFGASNFSGPGNFLPPLPTDSATNNNPVQKDGGIKDEIKPFAAVDAVDVVMHKLGYHRETRKNVRELVKAGKEVFRGFLIGLNKGDCPDISKANHMIVGKAVAVLTNPDGFLKPYFNAMPPEAQPYIKMAMTMVSGSLTSKLEQMMEPSVDCEENSNSTPVKHEALTNLLRHYFNGQEVEAVNREAILISFDNAIQQIRDMTYLIKDDTCESWKEAIDKLSDGWVKNLVERVKTFILALLPESDTAASFTAMLPVLEMLVQNQMSSAFKSFIKDYSCDIKDDSANDDDEERYFGGFVDPADLPHVEN